MINCAFITQDKCINNISIDFFVSVLRVTVVDLVVGCFNEKATVWPGFDPASI